MDPVTLLIGIAALAFGIWTTYLRATNPGSLQKLTAMQQTMGRSAGTVVHVVAYTVVPIVLGLVALTLAVRGGSLFG